MTDDKPKKVDEFKKIEKASKDLAETSEKIKHPRSETSKKYTDALIKKAYEHVKAEDPNYTRTLQDFASNEQEVDTAIKRLNLKQRRDAAEYLYNNLDEIVDQEISDSGLEKLLFDKNARDAILSTTDEKGKDAIEDYLNLRGLKEVVKKYKETENLPQDENTRKRILSLAAQGAADDAEKRMKEKGYKDREMIALSRNLAQMAAATGGYKDEVVRGYALKGLNKEIEDAEKEHKDAKDAMKYTRNSLKKLAKSENPEEFGVAEELIYRAAA